MDLADELRPVVYLSGVASEHTRRLAELRPDRLGLLPTPASGTHRRLDQYGPWGADNGCFAELTGGKPFDADRWLRWLAELARGEHAPRCLFATLPDVVGDWSATLARSLPHVDHVAALGLPVGIVAQPGATPAAFPWSAAQAIFLGGDDAWKDGPDARALAIAARERGCWVHVGRVNTLTRWKLHERHADSYDGTMAKWGADPVARIARWLNRADVPALL